MLENKINSTKINQIINSYDIIGDIAVIKIPQELRKYRNLIARGIMESHRKIKAVWSQTSSIKGEFRLRELDFLIGEKRTTTIHKEYNLKFYI